MSKKSELKKAIAECESEIEAFEKKRSRSQSALITSILAKRVPDPSDERFFQMFTDLIDERRETLRKLQKELDELTKK